MKEQELKHEIMTLDQRVAALVVSNSAEFQEASTFILAFDGLKKKIEAYWKDPIDKAFQAHRALTQKRAEMLKPVEDRRRTVNQKISAYLTEQKRIQQEAQRKADEERRRKEEAERAKLEKRAEKADEKGNSDKAAALRDKAADVYVPPVIVQAEVEKTTRTDEGTISAHSDIEITVVNPMDVIKEVAAGRLPMVVLTINDVKLKKAIKDYGMKECPGVSIREIVKASFRGK